MGKNINRNPGSDSEFNSKGNSSEGKEQDFKYSKDSLKDHLRFEQLLSELSTKFIDLPASIADKAIEEALQNIIEFLEIDRSNIYQYNKNKGAYYITHSCSIKGVQKIAMQLTDKDFPWLTNKLKQGQIFSCSQIDEIPTKAMKDKQRLKKLGVKSLLLIPMAVSGKMVGAISFDAVRDEKVWPEKVAQRGKLIGEIFANILRRRDSELELQKAFSEIKLLKTQIESDYNYLREEMDSEHDFHEIIGESSPLKHVLFKIDQVSPTDTTVLILGETGTGKELVARAVHNRSSRKDRPLVKVNCAAFSPTLMESELFGHEKGAFTGAHTRKKGRFETAHGTSFFLDEIGESPLELQAKLLRVIQDGEFERIGSSRTIKVDVRIIAATNKDLDDEVRKGRFRQDLLFRLNVFPITIPPLRKRKEDIPLLVNWFIQKYGRKLGKVIKSIPKGVMVDLQNCMWPGNVRELENTIERAVINTRGPTLQLPDISGASESNRITPSLNSALVDLGEQLSTRQRATLTEMERDYIIQVLEETKWRIDGPKGAALVLGLKTSTLRSRMKKLGIQRKSSLK